MKIGYVRVSTEEQNTARQEVLMERLGVEKVYIDKASGKDTKNRPQLNEMMAFVREGDVVIVESISRFARSTRDLLDLVDKLTAKGVGFVSQKEAFDTNTPQGRCVLTIFSALAEMEREQILERQREGIAIAKAQGKYKGRKPVRVDQDEFDRLYERVIKGECTNKYVMERLGLKRNTYYKFVAKYREEHGLPGARDK